MQNGIVKNTGNSRYLKSVGDFLSKYPTYQDFAQALIAGTLPIDLNGVNPDGWHQLGTALNKATLLADETAALFGLPGNALPTDVLSWIGKYNQHWWYARNVQKLWAEKQDLTETEYSGTVVLVYNTAQTFNYSDTISIDQSTGVITLVNPTSASFGYSAFSSTGTARALRGKYVKRNNNDAIWYVTADATPYHDYYGDDNDYGGFTYGGVYTVTSEYLINTTEWFSLWSKNRNAYPDSGELNGVEYRYSGVPFKNATTGIKIETGSYIGTGTRGESSPNSLTFGMIPLVVFLSDIGSTFTVFFGMTKFKTGSASSYTNTCEFNGNMFSWYVASNGDESGQLNQKGREYHYAAIGIGGDDT